MHFSISVIDLSCTAKNQVRQKTRENLTLATSDWLLEAAARLPPEVPAAMAAVIAEVAVEAELEAEVVDDPCFCCLRLNALVLSLEKSRHLRSLLA